MPDGIEITISGLKEVNRDLYRYSQQLGDRVVLSSAREGLKVIQKQTRSNARYKTGTLRRNILIRRSKIHHPRRGRNTIGVFLYIRAKGKAGDKRNAYYGRFLERGTKYIDRLRFVDRAFKSKRNVAVNVFVRAVTIGAEIVKRKTRNLR